MSLLASPFQDWNPFLFIILAGAIPTQMWRWMGAVFSASLAEDSEILIWVKAVATALVSALIANLVVFPSGALADVPLIVRVSALGVGFATYLIWRGHIIWGILAGEAVLLAGAFFFS
ncbi:MAG: AzlD domain-containing protein [Pseudomonadota bacterium]